MSTHTHIAPKTPNTSRSPIREALRAGIDKVKPAKSMVMLRGLPQDENEDDVRSGKQHAAKNLDAILQRFVRLGIPYDGPNGTAQILARADFALRLMHGVAPDAGDIKAARRAAQAFDSKVDLLEHDLDDMNEAELEDFAAYTEACARTHADLALAARFKAHQRAEAKRGARRQLAGVA